MNIWIYKLSLEIQHIRILWRSFIRVSCHQPHLKMVLDVVIFIVVWSLGSQHIIDQFQWEMVLVVVGVTVVSWKLIKWLVLMEKSLKGPRVSLNPSFVMLIDKVTCNCRVLFCLKGMACSTSWSRSSFSGWQHWWVTDNYGFSWGEHRCRRLHREDCNSISTSREILWWFIERSFKQQRWSFAKNRLEGIGTSPWQSSGVWVLDQQQRRMWCTLRWTDEFCEEFQGSCSDSWERWIYTVHSTLYNMVLSKAICWNQSVQVSMYKPRKILCAGSREGFCWGIWREGYSVWEFEAALCS